MHVTFYPFFGHQDKCSQRFRFGSDGTIRMYQFMAERGTEAGWNCRFVLPQKWQCVDEVHLGPGIDTIHIPHELCIDNRRRRLQWDPQWLHTLAKGADVLIVQHEFLPFPMRCIARELCIVGECGFLPDTVWPEMVDMFPLAQRACDAVHCSSQLLAASVVCPTFVWEFAYEDGIRTLRNLDRDIDVMFNSRCSVTNYTNHVEFLQAIRGAPWSVYIPDPTSFLRASGSKLVPDVPPERAAYIGALHRSRVVYGVGNTGYGGFSVRIAVACGACPVAPRNAAMEAFLTADWPYLCDPTSTDSVHDAIALALKYGWGAVPGHVCDYVQMRMDACSYSAAWKVARLDVETLYDRCSRRSG